MRNATRPTPPNTHTQAHLLPVLGLSEEDPAGSEAMAFHFLKHEKTATHEYFFFFF